MNNPSQNLPTRISLLELAQSGKDHPAWEELLDYYRPFIGRVLAHMGVPRSDIDDACQLALMRLWKDLASYKPSPERTRFRSWLSHLIRSTAVDWHRKQRRNQQTVDGNLDTVEESPMEDSELEQRIEAEWREHIVELALDRLRTVFSGNAVDVFVRSVEGESASAISEDLNMSEDSVYVLKHRVKKRLVREVYELRRELEFPENNV
ncbi:RNA polymerase, sigma-24 subunit, RpoE [Neorhodopirellula lusitana]|uniref:RNA polymerase, sigma-24 subunit, RpoE n=1 Tax=Neorhodopirellula lusitana TaxID=445327 RepID=A0ABY1Q7Q7_9BACT|nr:RNA polymerase sigma factor [Neorhodopirellula lusitana]SMP62159.1 RNA polymerase, sigma-24 subunit, RpoE [Neorhodopirellula lusitana]